MNRVTFTVHFAEVVLFLVGVILLMDALIQRDKLSWALFLVIAAYTVWRYISITMEKSDD